MFSFLYLWGSLMEQREVDKKPSTHIKIENLLTGQDPGLPLQGSSMLNVHIMCDLLHSKVPEHPFNAFSTTDLIYTQQKSIVEAADVLSVPQYEPDHVHHHVAEPAEIEGVGQQTLSPGSIHGKTGISFMCFDSDHQKALIFRRRFEHQLTLCTHTK